MASSIALHPFLPSLSRSSHSAFAAQTTTYHPRETFSGTISSSFPSPPPRHLAEKRTKISRIKEKENFGFRTEVKIDYSLFLASFIMTGKCLIFVLKVSWGLFVFFFLEFDFRTFLLFFLYCLFFWGFFDRFDREISFWLARIGRGIWNRSVLRLLDLVFGFEFSFCHSSVLNLQYQKYIFSCLIIARSIDFIFLNFFHATAREWSTNSWSEGSTAQMILNGPSMTELMK